MATILTTSGTPYTVPGLSRTQLRTILLEKVTTALPNGVTKSAGNPPTWIEFGPPVTGEGGGTFDISPNNVEAVQD